MSIPIVLTCLCLGWADPPADLGPAASAAAFDVVSSIETVLADAIARAELSVVAIARNKSADNPTNETRAVRGQPRPPANFDMARDYFASDYGSGIVIGDKGQILTAFHVVQGASSLLVRASERQQFEAEVIAADPRSDLAVIAPFVRPGAAPPKLKPVVLGDAGKLRKGSFLIALGNAFNAARHDGRPSASWGILSNVARMVEGEGDNFPGQQRRDQLHNFPTLLQLDSKLNLGMSGGAVINMRGELVGLTTTAESPAGFDTQAGYAIPIDRIGRRVIAMLKQGKEVEYGLLGIQAPTDGVFRVDRVSPNTPAAEGQIQVDDEIVAVDDVPVASFEALILAIHALSPGDQVRLKLIRAGKQLERTVVLAKFPVKGEVIATNRPAPWRGIRVDYASTIIDRAPDFSQFNATSRGVIVTDLGEGSPAALAGLKKGQVIRKVDEQPIASPGQFEAAVAKRTGPVSLVTDQGPVTVGVGQ